MEVRIRGRLIGPPDSAGQRDCRSLRERGRVDYMCSKGWRLPYECFRTASIPKIKLQRGLKNVNLGIGAKRKCVCQTRLRTR